MSNSPPGGQGPNSQFNQPFAPAWSPKLPPGLSIGQNGFIINMPASGASFAATTNTGYALPYSVGLQGDNSGNIYLNASGGGYASIGAATGNLQLYGSGREFTTGNSYYGPTTAQVSGSLYVTGSTGIIYVSGLSSYSSAGNQAYGDVAVQRSASSGAVSFGGASSAGLLDFGVTKASAFTTSTDLWVLGNIFLNNTGDLFFGNASGNLQIGQPGAGTVAGGVGASLFGVASNAVAWRLALDSSGNLGVGGYYRSGANGIVLNSSVGTSTCGFYHDAGDSIALRGAGIYIQTAAGASPAQIAQVGNIFMTGTLTTGSSSYGATSATVNGALTANGITSNAAVAVDVSAGNYHIDSSFNTVSLVNNGTQTFGSFSGVIIVNDVTGGPCMAWICGGGGVGYLGGSTVASGTMTYSAPNYVFKNTSGATHSFSFMALRTRTNP